MFLVVAMIRRHYLTFGINQDIKVAEQSKQSLVQQRMISHFITILKYPDIHVSEKIKS